MEHEKLGEAEEREREAKALAEKLGPSIDMFETQSELRLNEVLRQKKIEEIERIVEETMKKAEEKEDRIRRLRFPNEAWIYAFQFKFEGDTMIAFNAMDIPARKNSAARRRVIEGMKKRGVERWLPVAEFKQTTEKLKSLLLKGDLDDVLRLDATRILFEIMNPDGKLQPKLQQHD